MKKQNYFEEEEDIYNRKTRKALIEDDEISAIEEAFMEGYDNA